VKVGGGGKGGVVSRDGEATWNMGYGGGDLEEGGVGEGILMGGRRERG